MYFFVLQSSTPTTPSYSQSLDLETRMLDSSTMMPIPTHAPPLHTTVISGPIADYRHAVCPPVRPEMQIPTSMTTIPRASSSTQLKATTGKTKLRERTEDPCQIAPLKKRKIKVRATMPRSYNHMIYAIILCV